MLDFMTLIMIRQVSFQIISLNTFVKLHEIISYFFPFFINPDTNFQNRCSIMAESQDF